MALSTLSEAAWYAAAWLDTWDLTTAHLAATSAWLRQPAPGCAPNVDFTACRHALTVSAYDFAEASTSFCDIAANLTHTQRLALADEIDDDVREARSALAVLGTGEEPGMYSRGWQFAVPTRSPAYGRDLVLPDGAAGVAVTLFQDMTGELALFELWQARGHLLRIEQLAAAARAAGGRAISGLDPLEAHCVFTRSDGSRRIVSVKAPHQEGSGSRYRPLHGLQVRVAEFGDPAGEPATVEPYDTQRFVELLGEWVLAVPMRA